MLLLTAAPPALASVRDAASARPLPDLAGRLPSGWSRSAAASPWSPDMPAPDQRQRFDLRRHGSEEPVDVLVDYYRGSDKDHSLIVAPNRLWDERAYNLLANGAAAPVIGGRVQPFREFLLQSPQETRLVWWCYWKEGRFTDSGSVLKWMALKDVFGRQDGAALVALSVRVSGTEAEARRRLAAAAWALAPLDFGKGDI
jgi:EpsI family protein